jgi:hypothetical protein
MRNSLGLDPFVNTAADRPMVLTPTGYVPIEANAGGEGANGQGANGQAASVFEKYSTDQPRVPAGNPDGGQWTSENGTGAAENSSSGTAPAPEDRGPQYTAPDTGTRTDATEDGGRNAGSNNAVLLAGEPVKPGGLIIAPGPASLDPKGLNGPYHQTNNRR